MLSSRRLAYEGCTPLRHENPTRRKLRSAFGSGAQCGPTEGGSADSQPESEKSVASGRRRPAWKPVSERTHSARNQVNPLEDAVHSEVDRPFVPSAMCQSRAVCCRLRAQATHTPAASRSESPQNRVNRRRPIDG